MDYKELLKKYIIHVAEWEGVDFINDWRLGRESLFTEGEWATLVAVKAEIGP